MFPVPLLHVNGQGPIAVQAQAMAAAGLHSLPAVQQPAGKSTVQNKCVLF